MSERPNIVVVNVRAPGIDGAFHLPVECLNELLTWLVKHHCTSQPEKAEHIER